MMNHIGGSTTRELDRLNENINLLPVLHPLLKHDNSPEIGEGVYFYYILLLQGVPPQITLFILKL